MNIEQIIQKLITQPSAMKQGAGYLAKQWKCSKEDIYKAKEQVKNSTTVLLSDSFGAITSNITDTFYGEFTKRVDNEKGTLQSDVETTYEPKDDLELAKLHKIDLNKYKISTYWSKLKSNGKFTSSVLASLIKVNPSDTFHEDFKEFIKDFRPSPVIIKNEYKSKKPKVALIIPKQDAHFNKLDIKGSNNIKERFSKNQKSILNMLLKASSTNFIDEVIYIVGSDQFNSEWTSLTTKGTPQQNILSYQEAFTEICNHEIEVINTLLHYSNKVKVIFLPGNHDEFVGWHLIDWLSMYFRINKDIQFDPLLDNTKYFRYNNSAIMLNHGDDIKPKDLASKFPIGFKKEWSLCDNYYIFTGDKHHELSLDLNGIKFYQVPQLSSAKSKWDDKKGYIYSKAEMTAFVITEENGMSDVYKELI